MGPVNDETRGPLFAPALKELRGLQFARGRVQYRKEGAEGDIRVDVRGAVEWVDRHEQGALVVNRDRIGALVGDDASNACSFQAVDKGLVGEHVECPLAEAVVCGRGRGVAGARKSAAADQMDDLQ